jgi:membrane associated rhomboid family serine protease
MLLLPFDRRFDWSNPPLVTLLLILVNVVCYFFWQSGEDQAMHRAMSYYESSGMAKIEYRYFQRYLEGSGREDELPPMAQVTKHPALLYVAIRNERRFAEKLRTDRIIRPDSQQYAGWHAKRLQLDKLLADVTYLQYGWKAGDPDASSLFAHMFLHGGVMHLFGNMFFLLAVGLLVEGVLARWVFLLCYLLGGIGAAGFEVLVTPSDMVPGIGASGAISALMGMYAVLYWNRSVRVFAFLFVYFDYLRVPAILLLPIWVGNELFQMWSTPDSNINFIAHLGGFLSGALIGWLVKDSRFYDSDYADAASTDAVFEAKLERACAASEQQDFKTALPLLRVLHRERPADTRILYNLYAAERLYPDSADFHDVANAVFNLPSLDASTSAMVHEIFESYMRLAKPKPKIDRALARRLVHRFERSNYRATAEKLRGLLEKRRAHRDAAILRAETKASQQATRVPGYGTQGPGGQDRRR